MHQTKKGNQWYYGMKAHTGVDAQSGLVHSVEATAANVHDVAMAHKLLHGDENIAFGDSAYTGVNQREEIKALNADIDWQIAVRRSSIEKLPESEKEAARQREHEKASRRAIVEHPFHIIKNIFGFRKTRYRGISKNHNLLYMLFASSNLLMCTRRGLTLQNLYPSRA